MEKTQLKDIDNNPLYPTIDIADNLTTDDTAIALSAKQGKVLDAKVTALSLNVGKKADKSYVDSNITASAQAAQSSAQSANQAQASATSASSSLSAIQAQLAALPEGQEPATQKNAADIALLDEQLNGTITTRFDAPNVECTSFSNGNVHYNSNINLPVGHIIEKVILKGIGTENSRQAALLVVDNNNVTINTIGLGYFSSDTEVDVSSENIVIQEGFKYCIAHPAVKWGRGSVSGCYLYKDNAFTAYNDYYIGFGFVTKYSNSVLDGIKDNIQDIRGELSRLDNIEVKVVGLNLFNKKDSEIIVNKAFNKATGNLVDFPNAFISGFIPIEYGKQYSFTDYTSFLGSTYNRSVSFYDENKNFVGGYFYELQHTDNVVNTFTSNNPQAKYAKVVGYYAQVGSFMFVEGGELPQKYESFGEQSQLNPSLFPNDYQYIRMFRMIAGIGDSLMAGCIQKTRTEAHEFLPTSWLSFIAYESGAMATHYATGGYTAKNWIDGDAGHKAKLATDPKSWAYFIGFGTNDSSPSKATYPLGEITDSPGTDTFVGYYKQIIEYVHEKAPNAKIFCMSTYKVSEPYGEMVGAISELYSYCYFIDVISCSDVTLMSSSEFVSYSHFTTQGYIALAKNIAKEVNRIISENMEDFIYVGYDNSQTFNQN